MREIVKWRQETIIYVFHAFVAVLFTFCQSFRNRQKRQDKQKIPFLFFYYLFSNFEFYKSFNRKKENIIYICACLGAKQPLQISLSVRRQSVCPSERYSCITVSCLSAPFAPRSTCSKYNSRAFTLGLIRVVLYWASLGRRKIGYLS